MTPPVKKHEEGYRPVLVREETKDELKAYRKTIPNTDLSQERRIATAAIELVLAHPELHAEWRQRVLEVVERDVVQQKACSCMAG